MRRNRKGPEDRLLKSAYQTAPPIPAGSATSIASANALEERPGLGPEAPANVPERLQTELPPQARGASTGASHPAVKRKDSFGLCELATEPTICAFREGKGKSSGHQNPFARHLECFEKPVNRCLSGSPEPEWDERGSGAWVLEHRSLHFRSRFCPRTQA